jgi:hypothetical protein
MTDNPKGEGWLRRNAVALAQLLVSLAQWLWPYLAAFFAATFIWLRTSGRSLLNFVSATVQIPVWSILLSGFFLTILLAYSLRIVRLARRAPGRERIPISAFATGKDVEIWGVLWSLEDGRYGQYLTGPDCPQHLLRMKISSVSGKFQFDCPGEEGEEGHSIDGPAPSQLALGRAPSRAPDEDELRSDVLNRMKSKVRQQQRSVSRAL